MCAKCQRLCNFYQSQLVIDWKQLDRSQINVYTVTVGVKIPVIDMIVVIRGDSFVLQDSFG